MFSPIQAEHRRGEYRNRTQRLAVSSENYKRIISGEAIDADRKYLASVNLETTAKLWFLTNDLPKFVNGTDAELRRLRFLRFVPRKWAIDTTLKGQIANEKDGVFAFMQRICHLVEAGLRRISLLGQCVSSLEGLLRQYQRRLRALHFCFPCGDGFHPCSDEYVGKLCLGNSHRRSHLFELGDSLRIVDAYEHSLRGNVLAALDGYFLDPSVDTRGYIEPCCIDLALYEQWFRSQEIED